MSIADHIPHVAGGERLAVSIPHGVTRSYSVVLEGASSTAGPLLTPFVDQRAGERRAVAVAFAKLAQYLSGVTEVWLRTASPDFEVVVIVRDLGLERELTLRGMFIDMSTDVLGRGIGELRVFAESEDVPEWVRSGEKLL
jgi:hypothetical protein